MMTYLELIRELKRRNLKSFYFDGGVKIGQFDYDNEEIIGTKYFIFFKNYEIKNYQIEDFKTLLIKNNIKIYINDNRFRKAWSQINNIDMWDKTRVFKTNFFVKEDDNKRTIWYRLFRYKNKYYKLDYFLSEKVTTGEEVFYGRKKSKDILIMTNPYKDYLLYLYRY